MADPRYKVVEGSQSAHCCFTYTVVDTTRPWAYGDEGEYEAVYKTFERAEADLVCEALNESAAANALLWELLELREQQRNEWGNALQRSAALLSMPVGSSITDVPKELETFLKEESGRVKQLEGLLQELTVALNGEGAETATLTAIVAQVKREGIRAKSFPAPAPKLPCPVCGGDAAHAVDVLGRTVIQPKLTSCKADRDGECVHAQCPQLRDGEPRATGRHCPLDHDEED